MITREQAIKIVSTAIKADEFSLNTDEIIIDDSLTIEKPYCWIFTYTSKLWQETADYKYALAGNAPIIIDKQTGNRTSYSTEFDVDAIVNKYEEENGLWNLILVNMKSFDQNKMLLLKDKMSFSYQKLKELKNGITNYIDRGSESRLLCLQYDFLKLDIETKLIATWDIE